MFKGNSVIKSCHVCRDKNEIEVKVKCHHLAAVDQFCVQSFSMNDGGWPRNTISALARCQTMEQYKMIADRLVKLPVVSDKNSKVPLKDRFALIRPRYAQTPAEMEALAERLADYDMNSINTAVEKAYERSEKAKSPTVGASSSPAPASIIASD